MQPIAFAFVATYLIVLCGSCRPATLYILKFIEIQWPRDSFTSLNLSTWKPKCQYGILHVGSFGNFAGLALRGWNNFKFYNRQRHLPAVAHCSDRMRDQFRLPGHLHQARTRYNTTATERYFKVDNFLLTIIHKGNLFWAAGTLDSRLDCKM